MSLLKVNEIQIFNGETVTITAPTVVTANDNTNAALRITQTGSGNALVVEDSSPDSTPFVVDASGGVGIGTISPSAKLMVTEAVNDTASALFYNAAGGSGSVQGKGYIGFGIAESWNFHGAEIGWDQEGTTGYRQALTFSTRENSDVRPTERMRIDSSGNVGIGTNSPGSYRLNVENSGNNQGAAYFRSAGNDCWGIEIGTHDFSAETDLVLTGNSVIGGQSSVNYTVESGGLHRWYTGATSHKAGIAGATEVMQIDSAGNVGIGTSSPAQKLDVSGNINATGALTLGTALAIAEGGTGETSASAARIALLPTLGTAGQVLAVNTGTTDVEWVDASAGGGSGTVTSVAISGTDGIEIDSGSPITTSGTIALGINAATLSSHLSLGTAATTAATDYATAAQGALANSAVQPGDDAADLGSGAATDGYVLTADGAGGAAWEAASGGGGGTAAYVEHSSTISDSFTLASGTNRMYIGGTTFSGTITVAGRLAIVAGPANFTGTINVTGTLATV